MPCRNSPPGAGVRVPDRALLFVALRSFTLGAGLSYLATAMSLAGDSDKALKLLAALAVHLGRAIWFLF